MKTTATKKMVNLKDPKVVKELICNAGGMYDDDKNWIPLESGKILGVVELAGYDKVCSVIVKAKYQSINELYVDQDMKLHISNWSSGGTFHGELNQENIDDYNKRQIFDSCKISSFVTM